MSFEEELAKLNEDYFFKEFTFSKTTFQPTPKDEVELADNIVWVDNLLIAFQIKERNISGETTSEDEERWFARKVVTKGTKQIRDTLNYLQENERIELENHRGHIFHLESKNINTVHKVVCYLPNPALSEQSKMKKYHTSSSVGVIHLIPANDYLGCVQTLLTPSELSEYFSFREELISIWDEKVNTVPEPALMGQYLEGNEQTEPSIDYIQILEALAHKAHEWDMSGIISKFPDRVTTDNEPTDYYHIVCEIAKLKRNELREFRKRFELSMGKARKNEFAIPYRMAIPRTGCGFVFIPIEAEFVPQQRHGLMNMTHACKYDLKLEKCLGVSFAPEPDGWFSVEWCYIEYQWEYDQELDERLKKDNPFREVSTKEIGRYDFKDG